MSYFINLEDSNDAVEINRKKMISDPSESLHDESWIVFAQLVSTGKTEPDGEEVGCYKNMLWSGRALFRDWVVNQLNTRFGLLIHGTGAIAVRTITPELRFKIVTMPQNTVRIALQSIKIYDFDVNQRAAFEYQQKKARGEFSSRGPDFKLGRSKKDDDEEDNFKPKLSFLPIFEVWLNHENSKKYTSLVFKPFPKDCIKNHAQAVREYECNTWTGFAISKSVVEARKTFYDWKYIMIMLNHIRYVLCDTDEQALFYIGFSAHVLQKPFDKPGVALFIGGEPGCGKGMCWKSLCKIIGDAHSIQVMTQGDAVGERFTVCSNMLFRFYDEVLFNTQTQMDILKTQITEEKERMEKKFQDTDYIKSYCRIGGCTNSVNNFIRPGEKDRRLLLLHADVEPFLSHPHNQDVFGSDLKEAKKTYFSIFHHILYGTHRVTTSKDANGKHTYEEIENYGLKMWANFLYHWRGAWNPAQIPDSLLMWKQRRANLDPVPAWWMDCLIKGYIYNVATKVTAPSNGPKKSAKHSLINQPDIRDVLPAQDGTIEQSQDWKDGDLEFGQDLAYEQFRKTEDARKPGAPKNSSDWVFLLRQYLPTSSKLDVNVVFKLTNTTAKACIVPSLEECRKAFCDKVPGMEYFFVSDTDAIDKKFDRKARIEKLTAQDLTTNYPVNKLDSDKTEAQRFWPIMQWSPPSESDRNLVTFNPDKETIHNSLNAKQRQEVMSKLLGVPLKRRAPTAENPQPASPKRAAQEGLRASVRARANCSLCAEDTNHDGTCTNSLCANSTKERPFLRF